MLRELADCRRLAAAVDADDKDHKGPPRGINAQRLLHRLDKADDFVGERGADLVGRDLLVEAGSTQGFDDLAGNAGPHVARNQQVFELGERDAVEAPAQEDRVDALIEPRRTARQSRAQPAEPALQLFRRRLVRGFGLRNGNDGDRFGGCDFRRLGGRDFRCFRRDRVGIGGSLIGDAAAPEPHTTGTPINVSPSAAAKRIRATVPGSRTPAKRTAA